MAPITINGNTIDPAHAPEGLFALDAKDTDFILLQCRSRLETEDLEQLAKLSVQIQSTIDGTNYLCKYVPVDLGVLQELPFVEHAVTYHADFVQHPSFAADAVVHERQPDMLATTILLHDDTKESGADLLQEIETFAPVEVIDHSDFQLRIYVQQQHLERIAHIDCVRAIEPTSTIVLHDAKAMKILNRQVTFDSVANLSFHGAGQIIAVADSGFDIGDLEMKHNHPVFGDRVLALQDFRLKADKEADEERFKADSKKFDKNNPGKRLIGSGFRDEFGHGTHVAGCALGHWVPDPKSKDIHLTNQVQSPAPKAKLIFQHIGGATSFFPDLSELFTGACEGLSSPPIHTNSYGISTKWIQKGYTQAESQKIDHAMFTNSELLIIWAAGNGGETWVRSEKDGPNGKEHCHQISAEAAAKNALVVGATWNNRRMAPRHNAPGFIDTGDCLDDAKESQYDKGVDATDKQVWSASSKGPTAEGRLKPDVVAPGGAIISARSGAMLPAHKDGELFPPKNPALAFMSGTSQAAPFVAGCAAVIRECLIKSNINKNPSGSLIKALIINGAADLEGTDFVFKNESDKYIRYIMPKSPNPVQGFGLVSLENSLFIGNQRPDFAGWAGAFEMAFPLQGKSVTKEVNVPSGVEYLSTTMTYADRPGEYLQELLDFELSYKTTIGTEYKVKPDEVQYMPYMYPKWKGEKIDHKNPDKENVYTEYFPNNVSRIKLHDKDLSALKKVKLTVHGQTVLSPMPKNRKFALCFLFSKKPLK